MLISNLKSIIDGFFSSPGIRELSIKFKDPAYLREEQFKEIIGTPDSKKESRYEDIYMAEYEYYELSGNIIKFSITYLKHNDKIAITEIYLWRKYEK